MINRDDMLELTRRMTLKKNGLKDDAMLATLYEIIGENYRAAGEYCIFLFPAFADRSSDINNIHIYHSDESPAQTELINLIIGR